MRLVLWRHGRTSWNVDGRFQGQTDIGLDEVGREQVQRAAALLAALEPAALLASDLSRAADTAQALADLVGVPVVRDPRLRETHGGQWQGLTGAQIATAHAGDWAAWRSGAADVAPTGGETRLEVAERMCAAVNDLVASVPADATVVIATHGGAARVALGRLLDLPPEHWVAFGGLANANWSVLEQVGGRWQLEEHNAGTLPEPVSVPEG